MQSKIETGISYNKWINSSSVPNFQKSIIAFTAVVNNVVILLQFVLVSRKETTMIDKIPHHEMHFQICFANVL